jgi:hypothetical protein
MRFRKIIVVSVFCGLAIRMAASEYSGAILEVDLASDQNWTLSIDDGPARGIKVPGGGFNSDRQELPWIEMCGDGGGRRMVKDHVVYQRTITIPKAAKGNVVLVEFGAVNHGAEVWLADGTNETLVATHVGPHMPFAADLTCHVVPGRDYLLKVKAYPMWHYQKSVPNGFIYQEAWTNPTNGWASKFSFGIAKAVRLMVYPAVRIRDVFVQPSVSRAELTCDVWLENHSDFERTVKLRGQLSSWNKTQWSYPSLPQISATMPAHGQTKVTIGPVDWTPGSASYWWPNKPFREDYTPQLHNLNLSLTENRKIVQSLTRRFGFVEWTEGPFYYLVNGVRINFISDATPEAAMSDYDCYSTSRAFLPPKGSHTGCPETWRRYMRMGICANRIHQSTPTEYMMRAADETGFMLIPETAIRGYQSEHWHAENFTRAARELAEVCRNHPSACRYSLQNEENPAWVGPLADASATVDNTRPLVFEDSEQNHPGPVFGSSGVHAFAMLHYRSAPTNSAGMIVGMGECAWNGSANERTNSPFLERFAMEALQGRCCNWAYYSGWDWINYWPNFLEGMNDARHAWKQQYHEDRVDGLDGWNSPVMLWVQRAFSPYLVLDENFYLANGAFSSNWPAKLPIYAPGETISRTVQVFNDTFSEDPLTLSWSFHWDKLNGPLMAKGEKTLVIKPGFHVEQIIRTELPKDKPTTARKLFMAVASRKKSQTVFRDDSICFLIKGSLADGSSRLNDLGTQRALPVDGLPSGSPVGLNLAKLRNPVWVSKDNLRDPSVIKCPDGYRLFYSRFSAPTGGWGDPKNWHIAEVFTKDFVQFENDSDISPNGCASPGDVIRWHDRWLLPYQTYPGHPTELVFSESTNLETWSPPKPFLTEALNLPWNKLHRVIDPSFVVDGGTLHCFFVGSANHTNAAGQVVRANLMGHAITRDPKLERWEMLTPDVPLIGYSDEAPDGVENTMIFRTGDHWTMIYSEGLEAQHLAWASSPDLRQWKLQGPMELSRQRWTARKFGAPYVWRDGDRWLMILMGTASANCRGSSPAFARGIRGGPA